MAWIVPVGLALGGAIAGKQQADQMDRQRAQDQEMNAIETQYSPWINPQYRQVSQGGSRTGSMLGGAISGGMQGMSLMGGMQGLMGKTSPVGFDMDNATTMNASNISPMSYSNPAALGGGGMGSMYQQPRYLNTARGRFGVTA